MLYRVLPLFIAVLPLAAITASYVVAASFGLVPGCNPFVDGCTSISATGRYPPASYIFKPAHLLLAGLLAYFWLQLASIRPASRRLAAARWLGIASAVALAVYTLTLGGQTPVYEFMRRFGIYGFFAGTLFAQLLATLEFRTAAPTPRGFVTSLMLGICLSPIVLGAINFVGKAVLADPDPMENRIEWAAVVFMQSWFVLLYCIPAALRAKV